MKAITGFFMAWGNFCFIPCPVKKWDENARIHMLMMLPLLGILMGILWYGLFLLIQLFDIHFFAAAVFMACYPLVISGFIHLDGFMDCHDAIFSRQSLEKKREILKDPGRPFHNAYLHNDSTKSSGGNRCHKEEAHGDQSV